MDKEWIVQKLVEDYALAIELPEVMCAVEACAEEIAAQHEQEMAALKAQVVGMANAIQLINQLIDHETGEAHKSDWMRIEVAIEKALQDAPTVLWQVKGKYRVTSWGSPEVNMLIKESEGMSLCTTVYARTLDNIIGEEVDVLVLSREQGDKSKEE